MEPPLSRWETEGGKCGLVITVMYLTQRRHTSVYWRFFLERPNLFAICNNTFSKWWEGWRMACRRVLSSTSLLVRVRKPVDTAGNRNLQTRTYKQEIQLIQVARIWQAGRGASICSGAFGLSARRVHWVQTCKHANIVMGAKSADFFFDCWYLKVITDDGIWYVPRGHPLLAARLWIENVLKFQCLNWMLYPRVESRMSRWVWVLLCRWGFVADREFGLAPG
jgi:hypothetical protein